MVRAILIGVSALLASASLAVAEKVDMSPEELRETATHVVTGKVTLIYQRQQKGTDWKYTHYVAEVKVDKCEKGKGIEEGELIYVRYWDRNWIGKGEVPPSTSGHRGTPGEGDQIRVYLARNAYDGFSFDNKDGGLNVIGANGFEVLKAKGRGQGE